MSTSYKLIYDKFIKKLKNDNQIFNYKDMEVEEIEDMVGEHLDSLLDRSVAYLYTFGNPDVNLHDKDNEEQQFNVDLIVQEIDLLSDLMYLSYFEEEKNRIKAFSITFKSSELNVFSPANERKTTLDMIKGIKDSCDGAIQNYLSRDRETWDFKSIYQSSGQL